MGHANPLYLLAPAALLLSACGDPDDTPEPVAAPPQSAVTETATPPPMPPEPETVPESPGVETIGEIRAALASDDARTWYITADNVSGELISQSDYSSDAVGIYAIKLYGHASADTVFSVEESLMVSFNVQADSTTLRREVVYVAGSLEESYRAEEDAVTIDVYTLEQDGNLIGVSGRFDAVMTWQGTEGEGPLGATIEVTDAVFEAALAPAG